MKSLLLLAAVSLLSANAFANSLTTRCDLIGAHMTDTLMLSTANLNPQNYYDSNSLVEHNGDEGTEIALGLFTGFEKMNAEKGEKIEVSSKESSASYVIVAKEATKELGSWQSKPVDDHCAPYSDRWTYATTVEVIANRKGKAPLKKEALLVCTLSGGYHGYFGTPECPID